MMTQSPSGDGMPARDVICAHCDAEGLTSGQFVYVYPAAHDGHEHILCLACYRWPLQPEPGYRWPQQWRQGSRGGEGD
jgi:hypothetical protein